ncbi:FAD-binding domain-containing protein [Parathielavia appendiculata]|uniref:FAD-binding domain-containing protein n=1 Tax=Parathielavia appendiculata TaxID=2587402 RepID=A0AAN6TQN8_9PEZI|nr:FAD-binding domain-containing protein [Parathielavia appendiculata]
MAFHLPAVTRTLLLLLLITGVITSTTLATLPTQQNDETLLDIPRLTTLLSPSAQLLLPTDPNFNTTLDRWSTSPLNSPRPSLLVLPTTESDISHAICYADSHNLPFLATSGGHGTNEYLSDLHGGVVIHLRNLTKFELAPAGDGGTVAILGGGLLSHQVMEGLWRQGKQTVTGMCGCVSYSGPALGGGHGTLQGRYGLVVDQIVSARMVLGDGRVVVASERENEDLFWALRGAGHNFGVVSEFTVRVHDVEENMKNWAWERFVFGRERLEQLYEVANGMMEDQPEYVNVFSSWSILEEVDPDRPMIVFIVFCNGPMEDCREYTQPIHDLGAVDHRSGVTELPGIDEVLNLDVNDPQCQPQGTVLMRGVYVDRYDIDTLRNWWEVFSDMLATEPAFANSICLLEGYSMQGVQVVPSDSTAFAHRDKRLLFSPVVGYSVVGNSTLDREAERWSKALETAAAGSAERRVYVNYALGDESLQAIYGRRDEPWRLERLRALKRKYDPNNRFRFFSPIVRDGTPEDTM